MKVIVAGSRTWKDIDSVARHMNDLWKEIGPFTVITGGANGVDTFAETVAKTAGIEVEVYNANWDKHGRSAGFRRNRKMARKGDYLLALIENNSRGATNMVHEMNKQGKPVTVITRNTVGDEFV